MTDQSTPASTEAAGLPVVAWREFNDFCGWDTYPNVFSPEGKHGDNQELTPLADAQAAITRAEEAVQPLRDQVARLEGERDAAIARWEELSETTAALRSDLLLKAAPLDVGAATQLAIRLSDYLHTLDVCQPLAWHMARGLSEQLATQARTPSGQAEDAARYAWLRSGVVTRQGRELGDRIHREINRGRYSALLAFRAWCEPDELDAAIDAAIASTPLQEAE